MNIICLSLDEIQRFRLAYSISHLTKLFDLSKQDLYSIFRELGIRSNSQYVREVVPIKHLTSLICKYGRGETAAKFGVSISFF